MRVPYLNPGGVIISDRVPENAREKNQLQITCWSTRKVLAKSLEVVATTNIGVIAIEAKTTIE